MSEFLAQCAFTFALVALIVLAMVPLGLVTAFCWQLFLVGWGLA